MIRRFAAAADPASRGAAPRWPVAAVLAVALIACALVPLSIVAAQNGDDEAAIDRDGKAAEQQQAAIRRELATLGTHPWAAEYYEGDGLGANISLALAPSNGVAATWHGCLGLYGANRGKVVERGGELRFEFDAPNQSGFAGFPEAVRPVRWGTRRYLIPEADMIDFVNAIHRGFEPRDRMHGMFLLARGDEAKPVHGLPSLPPRYLGMIRSRPLEARVSSVDSVETRKDDYGCTNIYRLTLDRGDRDGLAPGLELSVRAPRAGAGTVEIVSVADATASGKFVSLFDDCDRPKTVPAVGWRFSTGAYDPRT